MPPAQAHFARPTLNRPETARAGLGAAEVLHPARSRAFEPSTAIQRVGAGFATRASSGFDGPELESSRHREPRGVVPPRCGSLGIVLPTTPIRGGVHVIERAPVTVVRS